MPPTAPTISEPNNMFSGDDLEQQVDARLVVHAGVEIRSS
jgi:hypothetical protein